MQNGLTLIAALLGLAVVAALVSAAGPLFTPIVQNARQVSAVNALIAALHYARSAAIRRASDVALCRSLDGASCTRDPAQGWESGWIVFVNRDRDRPPRVDADEPVLQVYRASAGLQIASNREAYVFRPHGRVATNGTLTVCDARGEAAARAVIISPTGRPRVARHDARGNALVCPT